MTTRNKLHDYARGVRNGNSTLSDADVWLIRDLHGQGLGAKRIRLKFDDRPKLPSLSNIKKIIRGETRLPLTPEEIVYGVERRLIRKATLVLDKVEGAHGSKNP